MRTERFISIEKTNLLILIIRLVSVSGAVLWAVTPQLYVVSCSKIRLIFIYNFIITIYTAFFIVRFFITEGSRHKCYFCFMTFLFDEVVISYFMYNTGGSSSPFYAGYFVTITLSAFVIGTKFAVFVSIFGAVSFIVSQQYYGLGIYNAIDMLYRVVPFIIIAFPTGLLSDVLEKYVGKINQLNDTLRIRNIELEQSLKKIANMQKQLLEREKEKAMLDLTENVAHRLRNPIMTIGGMADILDKKIDKVEGAKDFKKYVDYIKVESRKLAMLSDNLLHMSNTKVVLKFASIPQIVNKVLDSFKEKIRKKNIELKTDIDIKIPPIRIDEQKLSVALINIIENSIESMTGGGTLSVKLHYGLTKEKTIEINISDTGLGMTKEMLKNLFKPFKSGGDVKKGIGLPIAKHSIELIGGILEVDSKPGVGTKFKIVLPA